MSDQNNKYKSSYPNLRSRSIGPRKYKSNTFNRYSPRARMIRLFIVLGIMFISFFAVLAFFVFPNINFSRNTTVEVETLPTPEPTPNPYSALNVPDDIEFIEEMASWVKTDIYGQSVLLKQGPSDNSDTIVEMVDKENITVLARTDKWYLAQYNRIYGFIKKKYVFQGPIPSTPESINRVAIADLLSGLVKDTHLVNIQDVVPGIKVDMALAKDDNYLGTKMYPVQIAMIQSETADKLRRAQAIFDRDGYRMVIWDAYRPYSTTVEMYSLFGEISSLIATPVKGSRYNRGASVAITIETKDGEPVEMPTDNMTMDETLASRKNKGMSEEASANLEYLTSVMLRAGFTYIQTEWWHFDDTNWAYYPVMDYDLFDF